MPLLKEISPSPLSDTELVCRYQETGEQQVLASLFLRYSDLVYGCCNKYLGDQESAKDAVMAIYYELIVKLKQHSVDNFKSWLYVLAKNYCLMQLRKAKKHQVISLSTEFVQSDEFMHLEDTLQKEQQLNKLEYCMDTLNGEQKECVKLFYIENRCYNEITELTGNDWNKVRSLIQNGRRNLKLCMEQNG